MPTTHPEPEPTEEDPPFDDARLTAYLYDLMDVGAAVAQSVRRQADLQAQPGAQTPLVDVADQFERVARAMRRTALMIRHIAQNRSATPARTQARKRIIRDVEDAIQRAPRNNEALQAEFLDRLDSIDLEEEIATRPVEQVILDIRRDLGLENMLGNHPWERRTPRDIETLRRRAAAPTPHNHTPSEHPPDVNRPPNPNRCPHPPDPARELRQSYALARRLSST